MTPNDEIMIPDLKNLSGQKKLADVHDNIAWKEGFLLFENTPMEQVIRKIECWYGVHIDVKDPSIFSQSFTASFNSESIYQVLELLKITSNIDYQVLKNNVSLFFKKQ